MTAVGKTKDLLRLNLPIGLLQKNEDNPNKMGGREFDLLCDNIERTGLTDPILVRPLEYTSVHDLSSVIQDPDELIDAFVKKKIKFRIIGGHHRFDAATFLNFERVPATVIMDPAFDDEAEMFQVVRMNVIRGKMDPTKFFDMFTKLSSIYSDEVLQDSFGFADEAEFRRLIEKTANTFTDPHLKKKFKEAAEEVKTIDELSKLLNSMFTKYGDTLPYGYMVVDYGGKRSVWLRAEKKTMDALDILGSVCIDNSMTMDDLVGGIVQAMAKGDLSDKMNDIMKHTQKVPLPENLQVLPTKDHIEKVGAL